MPIQKHYWRGSRPFCPPVQPPLLAMLVFLIYLNNTAIKLHHSHKCDWFCHLATFLHQHYKGSQVPITFVRMTYSFKVL